MGFGFFYIDSYYIYLVIPALIIAGLSSLNVKMTFNKYNNFFNKKGFTGAQVARKILDENALYNVSVERVSGNLTDHYDPVQNVVRLSDSVYSSTSVGAIGVAAHEVGHAIQYSKNYFPIKLRMAIIPITQIGSTLSMPLILFGLFASMFNLAMIGVILFSTVTVFQLITLPVEFNASNRAIRIISEKSILEGEELKGAKKVLTAAALTYVASLLVSVANLLRLVLIVNSRRND